jgi:hypothetical protein
MAIMFIPIMSIPDEDDMGIELADELGRAIVDMVLVGALGIDVLSILIWQVMWYGTLRL